MSDEALYDVVIYELKTRKVDTVIGERLRLDSGHFNAHRRMDTGLERVNEHYSVAIVESGSVKVGTVLNDILVVEW